MKTTQGQNKKYISQSDKICFSITARHWFGMKNVSRDRIKDKYQKVFDCNKFIKEYNKNKTTNKITYKGINMSQEINKKNFIELAK